MLELCNLITRIYLQNLFKNFYAHGKANANKYEKYSYYVLDTISTSNHMLGRAISDELLECIFKNFEIARVKREQFQIFQKSRG